MDSDLPYMFLAIVSIKILTKRLLIHGLVEHDLAIESIFKEIWSMLNLTSATDQLKITPDLLVQSSDPVVLGSNLGRSNVIRSEIKQYQENAWIRTRRTKSECHSMKSIKPSQSKQSTYNAL